MTTERSHHRPMAKGAGFFDAVAGGEDPALLHEAAERAARLLVRGAHASGDSGVADRVVHLADTEGLETLADLWAGAPADTLAGCLFRLYVLRTWVHADPAGVAREYEAGRASAPVARIVAGVAEPPGPDELRAMVDHTLRGIAERDFADVLLRAAAFARVVAIGRAVRGSDDLPAADETDPDDPVGSSDRPSAARVLTLAEQLERAAHAELADGLS